MRGFRVTKEAFVLEQARTASSILHVGCTNAPTTEARFRDGRLLHTALCAQASVLGQRMVGIDIERASLAWLQERMPGEEILFADANRLDEYLPGRRFDLIIAGDVIEHLSDAGAFLRSCRNSLTREGRIVITTVNAFGVARWLKQLLNHEAVHPEHTAYYSHSTLRRLSELSDLYITAAGYYAAEPVTSFSPNRLVSNAIERMFTLAWPQLSEGVIVVCGLSGIVTPDTGVHVGSFE